MKQDTVLMKLKKQFLSKVMKKAWAIYKDNKSFKHHSFSKAMKQAWKWAKNEANKGKISKVQIGLF